MVWINQVEMWRIAFLLYLLLYFVSWPFVLGDLAPYIYANEDKEGLQTPKRAFLHITKLSIKFLKCYYVKFLVCFIEK